MKWITIGLILLFAFGYWAVPFLFSAMKQHDYNNLYYGLQNAKRSAGAYVAEEKGKFMSYEERYARGLD